MFTCSFHPSGATPLAGYPGEANHAPRGRSEDLRVIAALMSSECPPLGIDAVHRRYGSAEVACARVRTVDARIAACGSSSSSNPTSSAASTEPAVRTSSRSSRAVVVKTASNSLGTILVDSQGLTLYHLSGEVNGKFICTSSVCLGVWHPLIASSSGVPSDEVGSLGTVKRLEGTVQVIVAAVRAAAATEPSDGTYSAKPVGVVTGRPGRWLPLAGSGTRTPGSSPKKTPPPAKRCRGAAAASSAPLGSSARRPRLPLDDSGRCGPTLSNIWFCTLPRSPAMRL